ncbi:ceramide kinase-like isoform X2 [Prosopis cineraria]|uniref:ceramide kinase-like isoform X2 n=1 Tax=Prosopis cineraria TaxID=364024 RepID=UPI0024109684|nr:ceramide kinase-like isoform X2 [Prosopis cineraria]
MERDGNYVIAGDKCQPDALLDGESAISSCNVFLDHVGEVTLAFNSDGLSWEAVEPLVNESSTCLGIKYISNAATAIKLCDIYAAEFTGYGLVHLSRISRAMKHLLIGHDAKMYRFTVYGVLRNEIQPSLLVPVKYTFGHNNMQTCQMWVNRLDSSLNLKVERPKNLMVFVHPRSGKGLGCRTWEAVAPIFSRAKVKTKVVVTERPGQAFDVMSSITNRELNSYDGVVAVGGDGFFNEILNGFLSTRLKAPIPPAPSDLVHLVKDGHSSLVHDGNEAVEENPNQNEEHPLISSPKQIGSRIANSNSADQDPEFQILSERFRFGIIPAGSTDAIVMCTTGCRDPITSALHIVLGKKVHLDIAQVVRWKETPKSAVEPCVRYAASFAGYGFYGDVITESEKYRWMGPKRYDYAGTMVFLRHRSYEAEIGYLEVDSDRSDPTFKGNNQGSRVQDKRSPYRPERCICRVNCKVCMPSHMASGISGPTPYLSTDNAKWNRCRGRFLSVGAAVISCRNEKAPDGLVVDAHLSDGFLHLILIKDCPHAYYLWHLTELTRRGGNPFNFKFIEHHKVSFLLFSIYSISHIMNDFLNWFSILRPQHLLLRPWAMRAYGTWTVSAFWHTNSRRKCSVALFPCLQLVLKSSV